ncbi:MAG: YHS domain-containing protein [Burkholderiales bacterium]|jgi:YHS domain-containing protein|nr:YHS domain-containing protein [Burkholderiales bacterium]
MDTESLKNLGWLLVWGALFFVMMRYGCGAHMMGRHSKRQKHHNSASNGETKDPVCGMSLSPAKAAAASALKGNTYYFCSTSCRDKFEKAPGAYITVAHETH